MYFADAKYLLLFLCLWGIRLGFGEWVKDSPKVFLHLWGVRKISAELFI